MDFIQVAGWSQPSPAASRAKLSHLRSLSSAATPSVATITTAPNAPTNPDSLKLQRPHLVPHKAASTATLPRVQHPYGGFSDEMSTLPDPRSRGMSPAPVGEDGHHPGLNDEVAALSTKLINAINHQTRLDDTLSATRHELETANKRNKELEAKNASQREILSGDIWVRRSALDVEKRDLQAKVAEEKTKRLDTERDKKKIEQELENLTAALFEEANKMVIRAKEEAQHDHDALQKKNDQLKAQLAESEGLLKSQQEQLTELKHVMENMASERDDQTNPTTPSSPAMARFDAQLDERSPSDVTASSPHTSAMIPAAPTTFHHIIQPILRTDIASYDDFTNLARLSKKRQGSRVSSGSMAGLGSLSALGLGGSASSSSPTTGNSAPQSPKTPASASDVHTPIPNLRDTRFFKRTLAEDIEPTLRLDIAPGLSWLARRSVLNAMADGSFIVDPIPTYAGTSYLMSLAKPQYHPCSLCGESRKDTTYLRNHRFRTSEAESAQRYPLCKYCLTRVRSTCDFLGFLRMVKDGYWRADDGDQEKAAWEESVRLREQMFWARIGGGVVPVGQGHLVDGDKSRRPSHETRKSFDSARSVKESIAEEDLVSHPEDGTATPRQTTETTDEVDAKHSETLPKQVEESIATNSVAEKRPETPPKQQEKMPETRPTAQRMDSDSSVEEEKRLSISMPGAFQ